MNKQVAWWQVGLVIGVVIGWALAAMLFAAAGLDDDPLVEPVPTEPGLLRAAPIPGDNP
ncbi:hypothetical protein ACFWYW_46540 [Nonomuraea sp. NPDC059023]|uniref:hypothetical protein n=1 Tax=unclassified Nonomuraea TaxID=2593643 RepID=UPI00367A02BC